MQNTNFNINDAISDTQAYTLCFMDRKDITKMRSVSYRYMRFIDLNRNNLYSKEILNLKSLFYIYNDVRNQLDKYKILIEEKNEKSKELSSMSSLMITPHYGKRSILLDTVCFFSSSISQNIESFKKTKSNLEIEINRLELEIKKYEPNDLIIKENNAFNEFDSEKKKIECKERQEKNFIKFQKKYEDRMISLGIGPKENQTIFKKMMNLFGGVEQYEALPILDLHERDVGKDYRELQLADLTAPIMRGTTEDGRNFFVIRYSHPNYGFEFAVISQYVTHDYNTWMKMNGDASMVEYTHIINEGIIAKEAFEQLANVIKSGVNGDYSIQ